MIELLLVVAIIALLLAILMPSLARARAQTRHAACLSNLHQFGAVMYQHAIEHKDVLPRACNDGDRTNWTVEVARKLGLIKSVPSTFDVNDLQVDRMEIFHCPERTSTLRSPFLDYVVNSMDPEGPRASGPGSMPDATGTWEQIRHFDDATRALSKISIYRQPAEVIYLTEAEKEDKCQGFATAASVGEAHENWINQRSGALGVMDVWKGAHLPEGKRPTAGGWGDAEKYNISDDVGYRRAARKMHLNRFTNATFMDGHADKIPLANRTDGGGGPNHVANYAYWLKSFGVKDALRIAMEDPDLY